MQVLLPKFGLDNMSLSEWLHLNRTPATPDHLIEWIVSRLSGEQTPGEYTSAEGSSQNNCVGIISHDKMEIEQKTEQGSEAEQVGVLDTEVEAVTQTTLTMNQIINGQDKEAEPGVHPRTKKEEKDIISLYQLFEMIPDEAAAVAYVEEKMWGGTPQCPKCGSDNCYQPKSGRPQPWRCRSCKGYFSVTVGTLMEQSNLSMRQWVLAIHLIHSFPKGISSTTLAKLLGTEQMTAWYCKLRIAAAMAQDDVVLRGIVQMDETFIGGSLSNMHTENKPPKQTNPKTGKTFRSWKANKHTVLGMRNHLGRVIAIHMPDDKAPEIQATVMKHVPIGEATIISDESGLYKKLSSLGYDHETVNHSKGEYVREDGTTTNGIESFFSIIKRGYKGTHHYISEKHLQKYMQEFAFRRNMGEGNGDKTIGTVLKLMKGKRLTYKELTSKPHGSRLKEVQTGHDAAEDESLPLAA